MKPYEAALAGLTENANAIRLAPIEMEDWAMVANHLRIIEKELAEKRREIEAEATDFARKTRAENPGASKLEFESDQGKLVERFKNSYSFNSTGIILKAVDLVPSGTIGEALRELRRSKALDLAWKISYLQNFADRWGMELPTATKEIEDEDPDYLVGRVRTVYMVRQ